MQNVKVRQYKNADNTVNLSAVPITNNIKRQQPRYDTDPLYGHGDYPIGGSEYIIGGNEYIIGGNGEYQRPLRGNFGTRARRMDDLRDIPHSRNDVEGGLIYDPHYREQDNERYQEEQDQVVGEGFFDSLVDFAGDAFRIRPVTDLAKRVIGMGEHEDLETRVSRIENLLQIVPTRQPKKTTRGRKKGGEIANQRLLGQDDVSKPPRQQRLSANELL